MAFRASSSSKIPALAELAAIRTKAKRSHRLNALVKEKEVTLIGS
jgi:hypothetical protein